MISRIAVTPGEPSGIGPDLVVAISQQDWPIELVVCCDPVLLVDRAKRLGLPIEIKEFDANAQPQASKAGCITVAPFELGAAVIPGQLDVANGHYVLDTLSYAAEGNGSGLFDAIVTGPVHKGIINDAGVSFSGHTEFFAHKASVSDVVMVLATEGLRVALVTTHIPLAYVAKAITHERLLKVVHILNKDMIAKFGIKQPKIYVCGLNPHAGEDGHLGREEIDVITPALDELRAEGINLIGPLPADTLFQPKYLDDADVVLTMYHDQGLPVLKYKGFGRAVNITFGLPYIRTSVDHGTALDLAGTGKADTGSMVTAINQAISMIKAKHS